MFTIVNIQSEGTMATSPTSEQDALNMADVLVT